MLARLLLILLLAPGLAWAGDLFTSTPPTSPFVATGATAARALTDRANDIGVNVRDFGADNAGGTDASGAINSAITAFKALIAVGGSGATYTLKIPAGKYLVTSPINLEGINTRGVAVDAAGATLFGQTNGQPVVSLYGSRWINLSGLHVFGASTLSPSIGIQYGRTSVLSCAEGRWNNVVVEGKFTFTGVYIFGCESQGYHSLMSRNTATTANTFALVMDGINHWGVLPLSGSARATDSPVGTHEVWMSNANLASFGTDSGSAALWISHIEGLRIEGYIAGSSQQNVILWGGTTTGSNLDSIDDIQFDMHGESQNSSLLYDFFVTGTNTTPNLRQWDYRTSFENASIAVYKLDTGITSATMFGSMPIKTPAISSGGMVVFDAPSAWTATGIYSLPPGSTAWNLETNFVGFGTTGAATAFSGDGSALTGIVPSLPSNIAASTISNVGGVTSIALSGAAPSYNIDQWCFHTGSPCSPLLAHLFPAVTIAAPPAGGAQAVAIVNAVTLAGNTVLDPFASSGFVLPSNQGTGYANGNLLTMVGGTCSSTPTWTVHANTGGVVTQVGAANLGSCSALPPEPISVTGGAGTGLQLSGLTWKIVSLGVTASGAGYVGVPAVSIQQTSINGSASQTATATTSATIGISAGNGAIALDSTGTTVGLAGSTISAIAPLLVGKTKFTTTGCSISATAGSGAAGTYTSGTTGTCTAVITINGATGMTAPTGWACSATDRTTPADIQSQTATTATTVTIAGTTVSGDVIGFHCEAY